MAYNDNGDKAGEQTIRTAGEPAAFRLTADRKTIQADGNDLSFVTIEMVDKDGTPCPTLTDELTFRVTGNGTFKAACNGDATSLEPFTQPCMKLFSGRLVVIIQSGKSKGTATLHVRNVKRGLESSIDIKTI